MAQVSIKQLQAFVQVSDLGSFRRAAEVLGTTQPNISTRMSGLEAQLGVTLMARDAGSVRLTPRGELLLAKARDVLRALDALVVAAGDDALFDGVLRLGVTEMVVHSWLGQYLAQLRQRFPNIDVDLTVDYSAQLSEALQNRSLDLALQSAPFPQEISGAVPLGNYPFVWVAAPGLEIPSGQLSLSDLVPHAMLTHTRGTLPFEQLKAHVADADQTVRIVPSTNITACIQMTLEGLGVACLPEVMVRQELDTGSLTKLAYRWAPDPLSFAARFEAEHAPHFVSAAAEIAGQVADANQVTG